MEIIRSQIFWDIVAIVLTLIIWFISSRAILREYTLSVELEKAEWRYQSVNRRLKEARTVADTLCNLADSQAKEIHELKKGKS
jgi:hypothetical protein